MIHRCPEMVDMDNEPFAGSHIFCYQWEKVYGCWVLYDKGKKVAQGHGHNKCKFCDHRLALSQDETLTRASQHRCKKMVAVETRRNEEKAHVKGDRAYLIRWMPEHGWVLTNKGEPTKRAKLSECPFCRLGFPFMNQVSIE